LRRTAAGVDVEPSCHLKTTARHPNGSPRRVDPLLPVAPALTAGMDVGSGLSRPVKRAISAAWGSTGEPFDPDDASQARDGGRYNRPDFP